MYLHDRQIIWLSTFMSEIIYIHVLGIQMLETPAQSS